jgi:hypothetical protein
MGDYLGACQIVNPCNTEEEGQGLTISPDVQMQSLDTGSQTHQMSKPEESPFTLLMKPNPAQNVLDIFSTQMIQRIEIYTIAGIRKLTRELKSKHDSVDIKTLEQGIFIVRAFYTGGKTMSQKLVVIRSEYIIAYHNGDL